jgi:DNA helicase-2/ATP-dependent DNA helicase PcrA
MKEKEFNVFGPPGTGKTTYLVRQIKRAIEKHGEQGVMVASFTRAAAVEIADRAELPKSDRVGTLHALCFRHFDNPKIAETKLKDWAEYCAENGDDDLALAVAGGPGGVDDLNEVEATPGKTDGDRLSGMMQKNRARCIPESLWQPSVVRFKRKWDRWKEEAGYLDFTDLIERAVDDGMMPSPTVEVGFFDEAQDFSALEFKLIRQWKRYLSTAILVGDDDQTIYKFKGSNPEALIDNDLPPENVKTLSQSYRVPRAVHAVAQQWIETVTKRQPKEYAPRDADGTAVTNDGFTHRHPDLFLDDVQETLDRTDKTIMILASCSYMLDPILRGMKDRGIPFANRYRTKRGDWNPLRRGSAKQTTGTDRVWSLLSSVITDEALTWGEVRAVVEHMRAECFVKTKKSFLEFAKTKLDGEQVGAQVLREWLAEPVIDVLTFADVQGMIDLHLVAKKRGLVYPARVVDNYGIEAVRAPPRITIGTIHSTKGSEADRVYLFPDLSRASMDQYLHGDADSITRTFYVGMTRAKKDLIMCGQSAQWAVPWMI